MKKAHLIHFTFKIDISKLDWQIYRQFPLPKTHVVTSSKKLYDLKKIRNHFYFVGCQDCMKEREKERKMYLKGNERLIN